MFSGLVILFISMITAELPRLSRCTSSLRRLVYNDMPASCFVHSSNLVSVPVWVCCCVNVSCECPEPGPEISSLKAELEAARVKADKEAARAQEVEVFQKAKTHGIV